MEALFGGCLAAVIGLVFSILLLVWISGCYSATDHCAKCLDLILLELRAIRKASAPKAEAPPIEPGFCIPCGQPGVRVTEGGAIVSRCPQCGAMV